MFDADKIASKSSRKGVIYAMNRIRTAWHTPGMHRLMSNESPFGPSPKVRQAMIDAIDTLNFYPEDISTDIEVKSHLADYIGCPDKADCITVGNGSMEIIDMIYEAFIDEGDEILVPTPDYTLYVQRANLYGGIVRDVLPLDNDFNYDIGCFTACITPKTKLIYVSRPNNPDGHCIEKDLVREICDLQILTVIDEAYFEFGEDSVEDLLDIYPNLIITHTFSKAMGFAGLRFGYLVASKEIHSIIERIRQASNMNRMAHIAAIAAIDDREYIGRNVEQIKADRELLYHGLKELPGIHPIPSGANFVMADCANSGYTSSEIQKYLYEKNYLIRSWMNSRGLPGDRFFRITVGTHQETVEVLRLLKELMAK